MRNGFPHECSASEVEEGAADEAIELIVLEVLAATLETALADDQQTSDVIDDEKRTAVESS